MKKIKPLTNWKLKIFFLKINELSKFWRGNLDLFFYKRIYSDIKTAWQASNKKKYRVLYATWFEFCKM